MTTHDLTLLVGTYGKQGSRHLYHCVVNGKTGTFSAVQPLAIAPNASYLSQTNNGQIISLIKSTEQAGLAVFSTQGQLISQRTEEHVPACHLTYDANQQLAYTVNYHTGDLIAYQINASGTVTITNRLSFGPESHPHFVGKTTDGLLLISLLGQDRLVTYDSDWQMVSSYSLPEGTGPRHLVFHPVYKTVYVVGELDNHVHVLFYDGVGAFEHFQTQPTLPQDCQIKSWAGAIALSPCGHFLYVSNRGHNSITTFKVQPDGSLAFGEWLALPGNNPRDMTLTPQGNCLLVACLDSNLVVSLAVDPKTGALRPCDHIEVPEPVALLVQNP